MPRISSFNHDKMFLSQDRHRNKPEGDDKRDKIFYYCRGCVASMRRDVSYADMAKATGMDQGQAKYHFNKLRRCGVISTYEDDFK